eukprot:jgi/Mesen1/10484/ME000083S09992
MGVRLPAGCSVDLGGAPRRKAFPKSFVFGVATSAFQVEGAVKEGGRGPSIWDVYSHVPGNIADGKNADVASDQYHHLQEDVARMKAMGVASYRFSISWSRVLPGGTGKPNQQGIAYYNRLINTLIAAGIRPAATLYHWDLPQALHAKYGGWLNPASSVDFGVYAELCFRSFGDRVKTWITFNEPQQITNQGYASGSMAPGRCSDRGRCKAGDSAREPYLVGHNILRAHALASTIYRAKFLAKQKGQLGITLDCTFLYPSTQSAKDKNAAQRGMIFAYGWFADPIVTGDYPAVMRQYLGARLPRFTPREARRLKGSADFLGLNFYTAQFAANGAAPANGAENPYSDPRVRTSGTSATGRPIGASTASPWLKVVPGAMSNMLLWIARRYKLPIFVTENGTSDDGRGAAAVCDKERVYFYKAYLANVLKAIRLGANVKGYYAWSLLDNFEWSQGYTQRFGLHRVNFDDPRRPRTPKASAVWWSRFLHG